MDNLKTNIADCCKQLKISQNLSEMAWVTEGETHQEYLYHLLEAELGNRKETRITKLIGAAGFPEPFTFQQFRFDEVQLPSSLTQEELESLDFIKKHRNLILYGGTGTGKTMLSICLGVAACKMGIPVKFYRTAKLVNLLSESKNGGTLTALLKKLDKAPVIILDEFGYVPYDRMGAQLLFDYLADIHKRKTIILNTNLEFSRWVNVLYDEQMTAALVGRLMHYCHLLLFPGENNRLKESSIHEIYRSIADRIPKEEPENGHQ